MKIYNHSNHENYNIIAKKIIFLKEKKLESSFTKSFRGKSFNRF